MQTDFDKIKGLKYMYTLDTITIQTTKFNIINTHVLASGDCVLPSFNDDNTQSSMQAMCMIDIYFNPYAVVTNSLFSQAIQGTWLL